MSGNPEARIETPEVVQLVDGYVRKALNDAQRYDNSEPLDDSGVWSLHQLASQIYMIGFRDGENVEMLRTHGEQLHANLRAAAVAGTDQQGVGNS